MLRRPSSDSDKRQEKPERPKNLRKSRQKSKRKKRKRRPRLISPKVSSNLRSGRKMTKTMMMRNLRRQGKMLPKLRMLKKCLSIVMRMREEIHLLRAIKKMTKKNNRLLKTRR